MLCAPVTVPSTNRVGSAARSASAAFSPSHHYRGAALRGSGHVLGAVQGQCRELAPGESELAIRRSPFQVFADQPIGADVYCLELAGSVADFVLRHLVGGAAEGQPADHWRRAVQTGSVLQPLDRLAVSVTRGRTLPATTHHANPCVRALLATSTRSDPPYYHSPPGAILRLGGGLSVGAAGQARVKLHADPRQSVGAHIRASRHHDTRAGFGCALREGVPGSMHAMVMQKRAGRQRRRPPFGVNRVKSPAAASGG